MNVYCVDVGSIKRDSNRFGWGRGAVGRCTEKSGEENRDIDALVNSVIKDLKNGTKVALGFECPLYIPIRKNPLELTKARAEEEGNAWSGGPGIWSMGPGLVETIYILKNVGRELGSDKPPALLDWNKFKKGDEGLLLWEAMVTGGAKSEDGDHVKDARIGVNAFLEKHPNFEQKEEEEVHSLIGAALLRTGWLKNPAILEKRCLFVTP